MDLYFYRSSPVYWTLITFTNSHTDGRGCHERCQLLIWSNLGFNILLKDTLSCSQGSRRIKPATFRFQENLLYLLSHSQALLLTAAIWGSSWWTYPHTVCPLWKRQLTVRYPELAPSHYRERWRKKKKKRLRWFYHIGSYIIGSSCCCILSDPWSAQPLNELHWWEHESVRVTVLCEWEPVVTSKLLSRKQFTNSLYSYCCKKKKTKKKKPA